MEGTSGGMVLEGGAYISSDRRWRWDGQAWIPNIWTWRRPEVLRPADLRAVVGAVAVGVALDIATRSGTLALAATLCGWSLVLLLAASGRLETRSSRLAAALAALLAGCWAVRASAWLLVPDAAGFALLLGLAAGLAGSGSLADLRLRQLGRLGVDLCDHVLAATGYIGHPMAERWRSGNEGRRHLVAAVLRGLLLAGPIAALIGWLLASADPVFASFFRFVVDPGDLAVHALLVYAGMLLAGAVVRAASSRVPSTRRPRNLGATEALVVMAVLDGLFLAFAGAQAVAATSAGADTLAAAGVTYSDYARNGFFQLLWVVGLTLLVLASLRALVRPVTQRQRRAFLALAEVGILLVLVIIGVAHTRLSLYEDAYGYTMLRLYSHVFALFAAAVFVLVGVAFARPPRRSWLLGGAGGVAVLIMLGLNIANPEGIVVQLNLDRGDHGRPLDTGYLAELSSDAVPAAVAGDSGDLRARLCSIPVAPGDWRSFRLADTWAQEAKRACR